MTAMTPMTCLPKEVEKGRERQRNGSFERKYGQQSHYEFIRFAAGFTFLTTFVSHVLFIGFIVDCVHESHQRKRDKEKQ